MKSITIPDSVTSIKERAFNACSELISITIPNSVTSIGASAFFNCRSLQSITIPNSVASIGNYAFRACYALTSITIPNNVNSIGTSILSNCENLSSVIVESGNTVYDSRNNCNAIIETESNTLILGCQNTIIPEDVENIAMYAFRGCSNLTSITIPDSVIYIADNAFRDCKNLTYISYTGTIGDWDAITKAPNWNGGLPATVVHCTDGDAPI